MAERSEGLGRLVAERFWCLLGFKLAVGLALNVGIWTSYLAAQHFPLFPAFPMPQGWLDRLIPFLPETTWVYFSIYLLMPIGPCLLTVRDEILRYAAGIAFLGGVAFVIFFLWPTSCPRPEASEAEGLYKLLILCDSPGNAFPSLHAAFAVYAAFWAQRAFRQARIPGWASGFIWVWTFVILCATLTTKQHVLADIAAGSAMACVAYVGVAWKAKRGL